MKHWWSKGALAASLALVGVLPAPVLADVQKFGTCLVDSLDGKERKALAKWIFFAMAAHPEIEEYGQISAAARSESDQEVGNLITRMLTEDCAQQLLVAHKADPLAVQKAFELVGQVAMQELMTNQAVMLAITRYTSHTDQAKIGALLSGD